MLRIPPLAQALGGGVREGMGFWTPRSRSRLRAAWRSGVSSPCSEGQNGGGVSRFSTASPGRPRRAARGRAKRGPRAQLEGLGPLLACDLEGPTETPFSPAPSSAPAASRSSPRTRCRSASQNRSPRAAASPRASSTTRRPDVVLARSKAALREQGEEIRQANPRPGLLEGLDGFPQPRDARRLGAIDDVGIGHEDAGPRAVVRGLEARGQLERHVGLLSEGQRVAAELLEERQIGGGQRLVERLVELPRQDHRLLPAQQGRLRESEAPKRVRLPGPCDDRVVQALRLLKALKLVGVGGPEEVFGEVNHLLESAELETRPGHHGERGPGWLPRHRVFRNRRVVSSVRRSTSSESALDDPQSDCIP